MENLYKILKTYECPTGTIRMGVAKTEGEWMRVFPNLEKGDCQIKTDWFMCVGTNSTLYTTEPKLTGSALRVNENSPDIEEAKESSIDEKIRKLQSITNNFLFIEYYSHSRCEMFKIDNQFTKFRRDIIVLCPVSDGINKALDLAIEHLGKVKVDFFADC